MMKKTKEIINTLEALKHQQQALIATTKLAEQNLHKLGDKNLIQTIRDIKSKSEQSFSDIEDGLEYYHLKLSKFHSHG